MKNGGHPPEDTPSQRQLLGAGAAPEAAYRLRVVNASPTEAASEDPVLRGEEESKGPLLMGGDAGDPVPRGVGPDRTADLVSAPRA